MIEANELRIGNLVNTNLKFNLQVYAVNNKHVDFDEDGLNAASLEALQPIPLTPEILEKCGFEQKVSSSLPHKNISHTHELIIDIDTQEMIIKNVEEFSTLTLNNLPYLHQLQNLYFALTNTELEIAI